MYRKQFNVEFELKKLVEGCMTSDDPKSVYCELVKTLMLIASTDN